MAIANYRTPDPALRDLRERHEKFIARAEARGARVLSYDCPYPDCSAEIKTTAPDRDDGSEWDTLCTCPQCGRLFMKLVNFHRAWGAVPPKELALVQTED